MAREITCPGCSQTFEAPEEARDPWLECPRCKGGVVNLSALSSGTSEWRICVGVVLGMLAVIGGVVWVLVVAYVIQDWLSSAAHGWEGRYLVMVSLSPVGCGLLFFSGLLFVRAGARPAGRGPRTAGAVSALLASALVLAVMVFLLSHLPR